MTTETVSTSNPANAPAWQGATITELLLRYLQQKGYKLMKDESPAPAEKKESLLAVVRHGHKELIEVKGLSTFFATREIKEEQPKKSDYLLHAMHAISDALFSSILGFGRYFKGEKVALALALPDTERYRQIIENLEDYFTENNLDFKIYLVAESGSVQEWNLNQKQRKETEVPAAVMEKRNALRL